MEWKSIQSLQKEVKDGNSLVVQWLGLSAFTAVGQVQSLVRELGSHLMSYLIFCDSTKHSVSYHQSSFGEFLRVRSTYLVNE